MSNLNEVITYAYETHCELPKTKGQTLELWRAYWQLIGMLGALQDERKGQ